MPVRFTLGQTGDLLFGMIDPQDLAEKIQREFDRFCAAKKPDERTDHAINFAVSAWHFLEWVYRFHRDAGDPRVQGFTDHKQFRRAAIAVRPEFKAMQDITNASKHRELDYVPALKEARVSAKPMPDPRDFDPYRGTNTARDEYGRAMVHKIETDADVQAFSEAAKNIVDFIRTDERLIGIRWRQKLT